MDKYYTPNIEDLHIGYECEAEHILNGWIPYKFDIKGLRDHLQEEMADYHEEWYRTPYLTKEQIIDLGYKLSYDYGRYVDFETKGNIWDATEKGGFLNLDTKLHIVTISPKDGGYDRDGPTNSVKFKGKCPSINELRKILKLI